MNRGGATGGRCVTRVGGVVVLHGPAVKVCLEATLIAICARQYSGLPVDTYRQLADTLTQALAAGGQTDVREAPVVAPSVQPTITVEEAAETLGLSRRQTRRLAPRLGGRRVDPVYRIRSWRCDRSGQFIAYTAWCCVERLIAAG